MFFAKAAEKKKKKKNIIYTQSSYIINRFFAKSTRNVGNEAIN